MAIAAKHPTMPMRGSFIVAALLLTLNGERNHRIEAFSLVKSLCCRARAPIRTRCLGWVQDNDGEWEWEEDDPDYVAPTSTATTTTTTTADVTADEEQHSSVLASTATPKLPSGSFRPKQSLGQNFLKDGNTVLKILRAFHKDATLNLPQGSSPHVIVELGPGAGALTDKLIATYGTDVLQCIEVDPRSVQLLEEKHPSLVVHHQDVLQVNYPEMADAQGGQPLVVIGNLPYYITSQILFALADASHMGAVDCATVTMQWEVAQRMVAPTRCKDYGILSVVFQLYANVDLHFKIPPTVFYPQPKVDSALVGLHFVGPARLRQRLAGVRPADLRRVVTTAFQQRRKTIRNSLKKLAKQVLDGDDERGSTVAKDVWTEQPILPKCVVQARENGDAFALTQELCEGWAGKRPEELTPGQFVELTRLLFGPKDGVVDDTVSLGNKVWRKLKHGKN